MASRRVLLNGRYVLLTMAMLAMFATTPGQATGSDEPGVSPADASQTEVGTLTSSVSPPTPVAPIVISQGKVSLSTDASGSNEPSSTLTVEKPPGATVRGAYLTAASTGFTGFTPRDGDVTIEGAPIVWDPARTMENGIQSVNVWADVTSIVGPLIDGSPSVSIDLTMTEPGGTFLIDGAILAVIFDDPNVTLDSTIILAYGAQQVTGDRIQLERPPTVPSEDVEVRLGVGISYGFQPTFQDNTIDVNGVRLSSSAGGQDDGAGANGALITVGGVGDDPSNPPDPFARGNQDTCPRCDDELYDLRQFVGTGSSTTLELTTSNPSADDNFFFAALEVVGADATWTPSGPSVEYVAVGDSTTTGFSVEACVENRVISPYGCIGDPPATPYPEIVAAAVPRYDDLDRKGIWGYTISEAVTAFNAGQNAEGPWVPQLTSAQQATELVTVSLGANDMRFSDIQFWLGECLGVRAKPRLSVVFPVDPDIVVDEDQCRETAERTASDAALSADMDELFDILDVASDNGAEVVITTYFNPYNDSKHVPFLPDRSCELIHTVADIITTAINDQLEERAADHGFSVVDFKEPFAGHGAGAEDSYVFGTDCETIGALTSVDFDFGWPPIDLDDSQKEIQIRFDPHPNAKGTQAQADAILDSR